LAVVGLKLNRLRRRRGIWTPVEDHLSAMRFETLLGGLCPLWRWLAALHGIDAGGTLAVGSLWRRIR
jgi:hypothetical protein